MRKGSPNVLGMPGRRFGAAKPNVANALTAIGRPFRSPNFSTSSLYITGVTRNSTGVALGSCVVDLYRTENESWIANTTSDGSGNYSFQILVGGPFFIVAYKAGGPDVFGTSVNTLVGI
jgi:hypothetical protein